MNRGKLGAQLQARSVTLAGAPFSYTVGRGSSLSPSWVLPTGADYDVSFHGPNGFFRRFAGTVSPAGVEVTATFDGDDLVLAVANGGARSVQVKLANAYDGGKAHSFASPPAAPTTPASGQPAPAVGMTSWSPWAAPKRSSAWSPDASRTVGRGPATLSSAAAEVG